MKILQPFKISSEILGLIHDAKSYLLIVSPYVNLSNWKQLESELLRAKERGVRVDFFVRNEPENTKSWEQVESLGIEPRLINNLHAKFYLSESSGVISSMNLLSSSNSSSIEIGCKLDSLEELEELKLFIKDFIIPNEVKERPSKDDLYLTKEKFSVALQNFISFNLKQNTTIFYSNGGFKIKSGGDNYTLNVDKVENKVIISAILSGLEFDQLSKDFSSYFASGYFIYKLSEPAKGSYNQLTAVSLIRLSNSFLDNLRLNEKKDLIFEITELIDRVQQFKSGAYERSLNKINNAKESI